MTYGKVSTPIILNQCEREMDNYILITNDQHIWKTTVPELKLTRKRLLKQLWSNTNVPELVLQRG